MSHTLLKSTNNVGQSDTKYTETKTMTLQEMFNKAVDHFADMDRPSMSTPSEYGGSDCAYRGHHGNKCIVGAFIDDVHYESSFEGKGVLEYSTFFIRLAGFYLCLDLIMILFSSVLRAAGDTLWVMVFNICIHLIMVSGGYLLINIYKVHPYWSWIFIIGILIIMAGSMALRYRSGKWEKFKLI